jgi:hypothetical protein
MKVLLRGTGTAQAKSKTPASKKQALLQIQPQR